MKKIVKQPPTTIIEFEAVNKQQIKKFINTLESEYHLYSDEINTISKALCMPLKNKIIKLKKHNESAYSENYLNGIITNKTYKHEKLTLIAFILSNKHNLEVYLKLLPVELYELFCYLAKNRSISLNELDEFIKSSIIKEEHKTFWGQSFITLNDNVPWLCIKKSFTIEGSNDINIGYKSYFEKYFIHCFCDTPIFPQGSDVLPQDLKTLHGAEFFEQSYDIMQLLYNQNTDCIDEKMKIKSSALKNIKQKTIFKDFLQEFALPEVKSSPLSLFIVSFYYVTKKGKTTDFLDFVRKSISLLPLLSTYSFTYLFLPHIKGFRNIEFRNISNNKSIHGFLERLYEIIKLANKWTSITDIINSMQIHDNDKDYQIELINIQEYRFCHLHPRVLDRVSIDIGNAIQYMTLPCIKTICACLSTLGIVEVAYGEKREDNVSPYDVITHIRLTKLGEYAFGITNKYEFNHTEYEKLFELDDERLLIKTTKDNPHTDILKGIAVYAGNNRFKISYESFLQDCLTINDVENKIELFKKFICSNPPQYWENFFAHIRQRATPLKLTMHDYLIFELDETNKELIHYVCSDPELKKYAVRAEKYLLLIEQKNRKKFTDRLKSLGYLV